MDKLTQRIRKTPGIESAWEVLTYYNGHLREECWTLGNRIDAINVARDSRVSVCARIADEIGG